MKKMIFIFILILFFLKLNAQFAERNAIYLTGGLNGGNFWGMNINFDYVLDNTYSFQVGASGLFREPKSKPSDYSSGLTGLFTFGLSNLGYYDEMDNYYFLIGRILKTNTNSVRFNIAGGIGYTYLSEASNWKRVTGFTLGENYTYTVETHGTISLIINPKVEFPFTRYLGATLSPILQLNKDRTYIGVGFDIMLGLLRDNKN